MTNDKQPAALADHPERQLEMVARWYMIDKDGMATLCTDREDAEKEAKDANMAWPHTAPHRAVQLVEVDSIAASAGEPWTGGEEWEALAWHLCAEENGEDACGELLWEGGPIPEPWGDRWMKYESDAKRMIELVRKFVAAPPTAQAEGWRPIETAPKDKSNIVLLRQPCGSIADGFWLAEAYAGNGAWIWPYVHKTPTHWMPLPPTSAEGVEHG